MKTARTRPLWVCPKCGARFVTRNLWHSCGRATLDDWKARMGPHARELYARFEQMIAACGEYHVAPARTRIAFMGRVRFAGITRLSEDGMTCAFALPYPLSSPRVVKVEEIVPGWWMHRLRITTVAQLDAPVQEWLREAYRLMGMQERLADRTARRTRNRSSAAGSR
jgi:hypothetical protein